MHPAAVVKNLAVWFGAGFSFHDHVHNICETCVTQIHDLRWIRQYLNDDSAIMAVNALLSSLLDKYNEYCNCLF